MCCILLVNIICNADLPIALRHKAQVLLIHLGH